MWDFVLHFQAFLLSLKMFINTLKIINKVITLHFTVGIDISTLSKILLSIC